MMDSVWLRTVTMSGLESIIFRSISIKSQNQSKNNLAGSWDVEMLMLKEHVSLDLKSKIVFSLIFLSKELLIVLSFLNWLGFLIIMTVRIRGCSTNALN